MMRERDMPPPKGPDMKSAVFAGVLGIAFSAHAVQLTCAEDEATNALHCFAESELREQGGIRTAPFYTGGPKAMRKTPYTVDVQCATGILHLKDRAGVSFAGSGPGTGTRHSRELRRLVCEASIPAPKKKGRG